jgi:tetratricopeptide (TPR) repeat protein
VLVSFLSLRGVLQVGGLLLGGLLCTIVCAEDYDPLAEDRVIETRKVLQQTMSEAVYNHLSTAQELMSVDSAGALDELESLEKMRLNGYERALVMQTYGYVFMQGDDPSLAINYFERCLELDTLPDAAQQGMLFSLAMLYGGEDRWQESLDTAIRWFRYEAEPKAEAYVLVAQVQMQLGNPDLALPYIRRAIQAAQTPHEQWYLLELSILLGQDRYADAVELLRTMISHWPDKAKYWEIMSGLYMELENDEQALTTLMLAYRHGLVTEERKLLVIVRMNLYQEIPEVAGQIIDTEIGNGRIEATEKNLKLALTAWSAAKEFDLAIATIDRLALLSDDGNYYIDKAMLLTEKGDWQGTLTAASLGVEKGGLDRPGEAHMLMGTAYYELEQFQEALKAFKQAEAVGSKNVKRNAETWIRFVKQ